MASGPDAEEEQALTAGEAVRAFYHANDHPHGYRYVRLLDGPPEEAPEDGAAVGLSTGWVPATVAEDWRPGQPQGGQRDTRVLVRLHGRFADAYNQDPEPVNGMYWRVRRSHVRSMGAQQPPAELSLLVVRWWDYWNPRNRRSRTHNVANEEMLLDVLEGANSPHLLFAEKASYEVHSAFVRHSSDLAGLGPALASAMRGRNQVALYFLWPTQRPLVEQRLPGAVSEPVLRELMERMEVAGIRTGWPHPSALYRQLAGKLWVPRVSRERPDLHVPATVQLDVARWEADPQSAAEEAIMQLQQLRAASGRELAADPVRGVAKLGFSWMGEDVRPFAGAGELVKALRHFLEGSSKDTVCLVQERVEDVTCELRYVCCQDLANGPDAVVKELVRMRLHPPRYSDETFGMASHQTMTAQEARDLAFYGSEDALKAAEQEVSRLAELWLQWFRDEGYGTPVACRLDFLVTAARPPGGRGRPEVRVHTVELCECGSSLCGLQPCTRAAACLNNCLARGGSASSFTQQLPPLRPPRVVHTHNSNQIAGQRKAAGVLQALAPGGRVLAALLSMLLLLWLRFRRRR